MAGQRTFSYELLKKLLKDHPDWSYHEYAEVLTADNRTREPGSPAVLPVTVAQAISRYRQRWREEGIDVRDNRVPVYDDLIPWKRIPEKYKMHVYLRKLRSIARHRRGVVEEFPSSLRDVRQALQFERTLRENRQVVDLTTQGRPVIRPAEPWELNDKGDLEDIVARPKPGKSLSYQ